LNHKNICIRAWNLHLPRITGIPLTVLLPSTTKSNHCDIICTKNVHVPKAVGTYRFFWTSRRYSKLCAILACVSKRCVERFGFRTVLFEISESKYKNGDTKYSAKLFEKINRLFVSILLEWHTRIVIRHCNKISIDLQSKSNDILITFF